MGSEGDLRIHAGEGQMAPVELPGPGAVEPFIVQARQPVTALRVLPEPVPKRLLDQRLLLLGQNGLLHVQHPLFLAVFILDQIIDPRILQVQAVLNDTVGVDPLRAVGDVGRYIVEVGVFPFDPPLAADFGVPHLYEPFPSPSRLKELEDKRLDVFLRDPGRAEPDADFGRGQVLGLDLFKGRDGHVECFGKIGLSRRLQLLLYRPMGGQLPSHVPGKELVGGDKGVCLEVKEVRVIEPDIRRPYIPEHNTRQLRFDLVLALSGQPGHIRQIDLRFLRERHRQCFGGGVHMGDLGPRSYRPLGEHIRFSRQLPVFVQHLQ